MVITDNRRSRALQRTAFTLLEILVVVAIVVTMASVSGVYVFRYLEDNKKNKAHLDCKALKTAVETYMAKNDNTPPQDGLNAVLKYIEGGDKDKAKLIDPWGKNYNLDLGEGGSGEHIRVWTTAKDQTPIDDLGVHEAK